MEQFSPNNERKTLSQVDNMLQAVLMKKKFPEAPGNDAALRWIEEGLAAKYRKFLTTHSADVARLNDPEWLEDTLDSIEHEDPGTIH